MSISTYTTNYLFRGIVTLVLALAACSVAERAEEESAVLEGQAVQYRTGSQDPPQLETEPDPPARDAEGAADVERLQEKVRKELVMLPWYGVFDHLKFSVQGDVVTLSGHVTRPTLKSDAEARVEALEEVRMVVNNIEVLPLSPHDDEVRQRVYWAIFSRPGLDRYALGARPSIHIIVKNGHVVLEGIVSRDGDKHQAGIAANGVSDVFSVTNNLQVD